MANEQNLIPGGYRPTVEELSKGGKASGKKRREKKLIRESFEAILSMPLKDGKKTDVEDIQNYAAMKGKNITVQDAINIAVMQKALKGDVRAAEYIRDTVGQKPVEKIEHSGEMSSKLADIMDQLGGEGLEE